MAFSGVSKAVFRRVYLLVVLYLLGTTLENLFSNAPSRYLIQTEGVSQHQDHGYRPTIQDGGSELRRLSEDHTNEGTDEESGASDEPPDASGQAVALAQQRLLRRGGSTSLARNISLAMSFITMLLPIIFRVPWTTHVLYSVIRFAAFSSRSWPGEEMAWICGLTLAVFEMIFTASQRNGFTAEATVAVVTCGCLAITHSLALTREIFERDTAPGSIPLSRGGCISRLSGLLRAAGCILLVADFGVPAFSLRFFLQMGLTVCESLRGNISYSFAAWQSVLLGYLNCMHFSGESPHRLEAAILSTYVPLLMTPIAATYLGIFSRAQPRTVTRNMLNLFHRRARAHEVAAGTSSIANRRRITRTYSRNSLLIEQRRQLERGSQHTRRAENIASIVEYAVLSILFLGACDTLGLRTAVILALLTWLLHTRSAYEFNNGDGEVQQQEGAMSTDEVDATKTPINAGSVEKGLLEKEALPPGTHHKQGPTKQANPANKKNLHRSSHHRRGQITSFLTKLQPVLSLMSKRATKSTTSSKLEKKDPLKSGEDKVKDTQPVQPCPSLPHLPAPSGADRTTGFSTDSTTIRSVQELGARPKTIHSERKKRRKKLIEQGSDVGSRAMLKSPAQNVPSSSAGQQDNVSRLTPRQGVPTATKRSSDTTAGYPAAIAHPVTGERGRVIKTTEQRQETNSPRRVDGRLGGNEDAEGRLDDGVELPSEERQQKRPRSLLVFRYIEPNHIEFVTQEVDDDETSDQEKAAVRGEDCPRAEHQSKTGKAQKHRKLIKSNVARNSAGTGKNTATHSMASICSECAMVCMISLAGYAVAGGNQEIFYAAFMGAFLNFYYLAWRKSLTFPVISWLTALACLLSPHWRSSVSSLLQNVDHIAILVSPLLSTLLPLLARFIRETESDEHAPQSSDSEDD